MRATHSSTPESAIEEINGFGFRLERGKRGRKCRCDCRVDLGSSWVLLAASMTIASCVDLQLEKGR
jgi:hypothetical protein